MSASINNKNNNKGEEPNMLGVDEFYNMWAETFYFRLLVDVRKKEAFEVDHASTAIHYDPSEDSVGSFIKKQIEESPLFDKLVFYDSLPFNLSKILKRIASKLENGKSKNKPVFFLHSMYPRDGICRVLNFYLLSWDCKC